MAGEGAAGVEFEERYATEVDLARALLGDRCEAIKVLSSKASTDNGPEYLALLPNPPPPAPRVQAGDRAGEPRR